MSKILEMIRFSHTLFALPFALLAAVMAWTVPARDDVLPAEMQIVLGFRWRELAGLLLCMVFARSASMAFNRLADRRNDDSQRGQAAQEEHVGPARRRGIGD